MEIKKWKKILCEAIADAKKMQQQGEQPPAADTWWYGGWLADIVEITGPLDYDPHPMGDCWAECKSWEKFWNRFWDEIHTLEAELEDSVDTQGICVEV